MNVLSLFDGMSCGQIALNKIGIKPEKYYAAEVDKYAITVTQANYPETIQMGDVTKWCEWDIDWAGIDLLIGGSPCQGFSFAGKQLAFDDPRSKLFFVYVDILNHIRSANPDIKFLLENVKMKKEYLDVISEHLGVEPVFINSALVSAQNRQRYYWANWEFGQPEDKGVLLVDILEDAPEEYLHSEQAVEYMNRTGATGRMKWTYAFHSEEQKGKSQCLTANFFKGVPNNVLVCAASRGRYNTDGSTSQRIEWRKDRKTNSLTTVQKDNQLYNPEENVIVRKFTPVECERLQTVPDNFTAHVSNTQRYKILGNGWTVDVIAHILKEMTK